MSVGCTVGSEITYGSGSGVSGWAEASGAAEEADEPDAAADAAADALPPGEEGAAPQAARDSDRDSASKSGRNRRIEHDILSEIST